MTAPGRDAILGLVLAGGLARRMGGGDKCLAPLAGRPLLAHILDRLMPQVGAVALNANGDPARFAAFGLPVVPDGVPGFAGPLAGVLAGLDRARERHPAASHVLTVAGDAPFLPRDLAARLAAALAGDAADIATAASGRRSHPVFALWPVALAADLRRALVDDDVRKVDRFTAGYRLATVTFADTPVDPFFNVNTGEDLEAAARLAG